MSADCVSGRIHAELKAGELLREREKAKVGGSNQHKKKDTSQRASNPKTLKQLGVSETQSSRWQQLAEDFRDLQIPLLDLGYDEIEVLVFHQPLPSVVFHFDGNPLVRLSADKDPLGLSALFGIYCRRFQRYEAYIERRVVVRQDGLQIPAHRTPIVVLQYARYTFGTLLPCLVKLVF